MKLVLGHIIGFLFATTVAAALFFGLFSVFIGAIAFVTWSLPIMPIDWLLVIRMCFVFGIFIGLGFTFSKEGREAAKDFINGI